GGAVRVEAAVDHVFDGPLVFAAAPTQFKVGACATGRLAHDDGVLAGPRLARHDPASRCLADSVLLGDLDPALASSVHSKPPYLYLLLVDTCRVDLSIPKIYIARIWRWGRTAVTQGWGWSDCKPPGAGAAMNR